MKRFFILLVTFVVLLLSYTSANEKSASLRSIVLTPNMMNLMLVGDEAVIKSASLHKNINYVKCEVQGEAVSFAGKSGTPSSGYSFRFKAIKPGDVVIMEKISKLGKREENTEIKKFAVRVYAESEIPRTPISSIAEHPEKYAGRFVLISGISRGWGRPEKAEKVWGEMVTRSDWIIEDETGAAYVSGIPKVEKGKAVNIICRVLIRPNSQWALMGHRILAETNQAKGLNIIARDNNQFALDLYKKLSKKRGNVFFSPFSISDALAMTYAGARGNTEKQMAKVLHFSLPQEELHLAFSSLIERLEVKPGKKAYKVHIANALWGQKDYHFLEKFKALIDRYYNGGFYNVDFAGNTEVARKRINTWIEQKTEEKIKNLIARGDIDSLTRLVLTNAIYFKGKWASQFKKKNTKSMPFHVTSKKSVKIPMMFQEGQFPYFENGNLQVLELLYAGDELSMIILLPAKKDGLAELEQHLTEKTLSQWLVHLHKREIKVYMPRFKLKTKYYLARNLAAMGMSDAFFNRADFSGMTGNKELKISRVIHQAYVEVNEEGTEAAAATAVTMRLKAIMRHPVFRADHPFIFLIIHKKTGSILFMGRVSEIKKGP